ncbi:hypothetical protein K4F52_005573 [Lecanicillium sp. MT-2017a]|nr:hypothetical protein K4F52_005573 [Lecanicillium sp. MT-2017a]
MDDESSAMSLYPASISTNEKLPGCVRKERCDACENLFQEMCPDVRYTWACAHVYCEPCYKKTEAKAKHPLYLFQYCIKCGGVIVRPDNAYPCSHAVPVVRFQPELVLPGTDVFPQEYRLLISQSMGHECQRCSVMALLRGLTHQVRREVSVLPYEGEVYACLQVNGHILHGMMNEFPESTVDLAADAPIAYSKNKITEMVFDISALMSRFPWEPNFKPIGDMTLNFRVRGWRNFLMNKPEEAAKVRVRFQA